MNVQVAAAAAAGNVAPADIEAAARQAAAAVVAAAVGVAVADVAPGNDAVNQALTAAQSLAAKQLVREEFSLAVAQVKAALNPPVVLMLMLYPSVIAFTLAARYTKYGLLVPTPDMPSSAPPSSELATSPHNEWLTTSQESLWFSGISFSAVTLIHVFLVIYITLKGPPNSPRMSRKFSWFAPAVFWFCSSAYFFAFILARYGVAWQEWVLFGGFTGGLFVVTVVIICVTVSLADVVRTPPPA